MEFNDNLPIYIQIMDLLKAQMSAGEIDLGEKLPSVRDLSHQLKVNPNTIQRSYQELEREELVYTQRGTGTFVTEDLESIKLLRDGTAKKLVYSFIGEMRGLGYRDQEIVSLVRDFLNEGVGKSEDSKNRELS